MDHLSVKCSSRLAVASRTLGLDGAGTASDVSARIKQLIKAMKKAGIRDVALVAGVSSAAVSYVFSGRGRVSEETRARVLDAATALG